MKNLLLIFIVFLTVESVWGQVCNDPICHFVSGDGKTEIWHVNRPPVAQPQTEFNLIKFKYLDEVLIDAGGCVNTHGIGKTSKRYINPSGPNSDRLYSGMIKIPGITADLDKIVNYMSKQNILLKPPHIEDESKLFLTLGYVDDGAENYEDNDYNSQDDGTEDQCKGVGDAWFRATIIHHTEADVPGVPHPKAPLDVWWNQIDDNYLPSNPLFGSEYFSNGHPNAINLCDRFPNGGDNTGFGNPPCTSQRPTVDEPSGYASVVCQRDHPEGTVHGHVNWFNVSYSGNIFFQDWQDGFFEDDDIDLSALTSNKNGVLSTNPEDPKRIVLEFKYGETIKFFNTPWWNSLKSNLEDDNTGWLKIRQAIDGKPAYFSGLFGIDNQHEVQTEIHPVHFLAIKYYEDFTNEKWAFFARNWGNEGFCSQDFHGLSVPSYNFFIPNAGNLDLPNTIVRTNLPSSFTYNIFDDGIVVSLPMASGGNYGLWHGEISVMKNRPTMENAVKLNYGQNADVSEKEIEGFGRFANLLTKDERKRWRKKYEKAIEKIESLRTDFINSQAVSSLVVMPRLDSTIQRRDKILDITEERELPVESRQLRMHDYLGTLKKDLLYSTLNESVKKKSRRLIVFSDPPKK
jgi:hypothetical protein